MFSLKSCSLTSGDKFVAVLISHSPVNTCTCKVSVDLLLGLIDLSMGTGSFAGVMRLRGLMLIPHLPSSTEVQYGYSCTSTSPHCLLGILFDSLYIFGRNISDWGDFALRNQLLWTSYFTFRKLCDSIDAGVGRLKYVTHVDTSIFFFAHQPYLHSYWWVDFLQLYVPFEVPWFLYFLQETVITFIHFPAFPSELLLIQQ